MQISGYQLILKPVGRLAIISIICIFFHSANADENRWSTNGPTGGSVKTIAIHPFDNQTIYIGTIQNGIYKSRYGGQDWTQIGSHILPYTMRVIAIHPNAPDTIYVATVHGMYKSTDGGDDWALLHPPQGELNEYRAFAINPAYPNVLFAGGPMPHNQWQSTDSGESWYELNISSVLGIDGFSIDALDPYIMYFVSGSVPLGKGIWKSEDMGRSWFVIQNNIDSVGSGEDIAIDPVNSQILYFALADYLNETGRCLWKSTNGGASWFDISPVELSMAVVLRVRVCPLNHNVVFICTQQDGVLRSTDGGESWEQKNEGLRVLEPATLEFDEVPGRIYLGTYHDGIYRTNNLGESWQKISSDIFLSHSHDLAISNINPEILYVAARNGLFRSNDGAESWGFVDLGIPFVQPTTVALDKYEINNIYVGSSAFPPINPAGIYRSTDGGESWQFFNDGLPSDVDYADMAISYFGDDDKRIFLSSIALSGGVYRSDDLGETWSLCQNGLPSGPKYSVIEVAPSDPNLIAAGCWENRIFISHDRGDSWSEIPNVPGDDWVKDIEFDPVDNDKIYTAIRSAGLYRSTDGGEGWTNISNNLPWENHLYISGITINPHNTSNIFAYVGENGVYQSHNEGESWEPFNEGLDTTSLSAHMFFTPDDTSQIFLATSDRSVWSITRTMTEIAEDYIDRPGDFRMFAYPNPFNLATTITYSLPSASDITIEIYDILGRKIETLISENQQPGLHQAKWNAENVSSGIYFYRLEAEAYSETRSCLILK